MTVPTSQSAWHGWRLFAVLAVAVLCMTALVLALQAQPVEGLRSAIRATARSSFALFLAAFLASSLATLVPGPGTRALLRERRYLGLAFAFSHAVHALLILAYWKLFPETFWSGRSVAANIPGSIGYLFILLLTLTSFRPPPDCSAHVPGKPCTRPAPGCWRASSACRSSNASPWAAGTYWRSPRSSPPSSSSSPPSSPCACVVATYSRPDPSTTFSETSIMQASDLRAWRPPLRPARPLRRLERRPVPATVPGLGVLRVRLGKVERRELVRRYPVGFPLSLRPPARRLQLGTVAVGRTARRAVPPARPRYPPDRPGADRRHPGGDRRRTLAGGVVEPGGTGPRLLDHRPRLRQFQAPGDLPGGAAAAAVGGSGEAEPGPLARAAPGPVPLGFGQPQKNPGTRSPPGFFTASQDQPTHRVGRIAPTALFADASTPQRLRRHPPAQLRSRVPSTTPWVRNAASNSSPAASSTPGALRASSASAARCSRPLRRRLASDSSRR